ncbi:MAG: serine hydrolase domain-containing protein, partial [Flavobacteriales bacterium]
MRNILFTLLFIIQFVGQTHSQVNTEWLKKFVDDQRIAWKVPGVAFGLVANDSLVLAYGSGVCKEGAKEKVDSKTMFGIASNTKAFTSAAVALLVEEGKLKWDDKVTQYLPWFELYDPYVTKQFTIRDLLTHHSGLATFSGDAMWYASTLSRTDIIKRAKYLKPVTGFREAFGYSNIMYLTAGEIISAVSGMNYDEFIKTKFFAPLGMNSTNSSVKNNPVTNVAAPHAQVNDKNITIPYVDWDNMAPAGSINSNIEDLSKWVRMWLSKGKFNDKEIIKPSSITQLWNVVTPQPVNV